MTLKTTEETTSAASNRNRVIRRPEARKMLLPAKPPTKTAAPVKNVTKKPVTPPETSAVKPTKKVAKKPKPKQPILQRLTAKELFEVKPTKKFAIESWQQGVAIGEQDMPNVGIAFPSFCWEMFTGHSVLPASSCYALAGPTGSFKSHLVIEFARWILSSGGYAILAENEAKYNKDMAEAVIGPAASDIYVYKCASFNQVEQSLTTSVKKADDEKHPPLMLQIVDSIVGNSTESQQAKVKKDGELERDYPANALAAANFLPNYMPMLGNKPYLGVWVTHSKEEKSNNPYTAPEITMKGGGAWEYRCRIAFILNRISNKPVYDDRIWSLKLMLTLKKDAAIRGFKLPFTIRCQHVPITGEDGDVYSVRIVKFCWNAASLNLWQEPEKYGYPDYYNNVVKDLTGFTAGKIEGGLGFYAPKIGVAKSDASRDPKIIMDALYADEGILDRMRAEMGIQKGLEISPEHSFESRLKEAKQIAMRRAKKAQETAKITTLKRDEISEYD